MRRPAAILIAGPTASGKSALALRLAGRLRGRVINADSMQVYRDLSILTARPSQTDMLDVPHALYGTIDGAENYSVRRWLQEAQSAFRDAKAGDWMPIFVGGTGLYFKALTQGLSDIPAVPDDVRHEIRDWAAGHSVHALHEELARRDPATAARLRPSDPQRILRALEVHAATGKGLASFQGKRDEPLLDPAKTLAFFLTVERETLRARIDHRFDRMILDGALDEVATLAARHLDATLPIMRAIGVPPLLRHLAGEISITEAMKQAKAASRQYLKRQETFARHQLTAFRPVEAAQAETHVMTTLQSA